MTDIQNANSKGLKIDNVLSSQPELGPSIPDGGYGWIILLATMFFQVLVPSMTVAYGVFLVFLRIENSLPEYPQLWDNPLIYAPMFFIATWTFVDPWSRSIISNSIWPRLVATSGTCLTCCGLLFIWLAISNGTRTAPWFVVSGILSGLGASIVMSQCEVILRQYFKMKLRYASTCIQVTISIGFIFTPILLGNYILKDGIMSVILWYQIIILQGVVVCLFLRKPAYLKGTGKFYKLIQGMPDDEVDIFAKNTTELQNARHSLNIDENPVDDTSNDQSTPSINFTNPGAVQISSTSNGGINVSKEENTQTEQNTGENLIDIEIHATSSGEPEWEKFEEDGSEKTNTNSKVQSHLRKSFSGDSNTDLERIDTFEDNFVHVPKPLFTETHINNNNTYSYDNVDSTSEEPVVFMPVSNTKVSSFSRDINFIKQPTFYKSLLQIITLKFSTFTFYALFPSHLYMRITSIRVHQTTYIIGYLSISSMVFAVLFAFIKANTSRRALFLWIFSWTGALGFIMLSDIANETVLILGAMQVIISIHSLQYFGGPLLKLSLHGETNRTHIILSVLSGLAFLIFFAIDMSYVNCFRMMALIQFVMGGIWFSNFLFKKIKPMYFSGAGH